MNQVYPNGTHVTCGRCLTKMIVYPDIHKHSWRCPTCSQVNPVKHIGDASGSVMHTTRHRSLELEEYAVNRKVAAERAAKFKEKYTQFEEWYKDLLTERGDADGQN